MLVDVSSRRESIDKHLALVDGIEGANLREDLIKEPLFAAAYLNNKAYQVHKVESFRELNISQFLEKAKDLLIFVTSNSYLLISKDDSNELRNQKVRSALAESAAVEERQNSITDTAFLQKVFAALPMEYVMRMNHGKLLSNLDPKQVALMHDVRVLTEVLRDKDSLSQWKDVSSITRNKQVPGLLGAYFGSELINLVRLTEKEIAFQDDSQHSQHQLELQRKRQERADLWRKIKLPLISGLAAIAGIGLAYRVGEQQGKNLSSNKNEEITASLVKNYLTDEAFKYSSSSRVYLPISGEGQLAQVSIIGFEKGQYQGSDSWAFEVALTTKAGFTRFRALLTEKSQGFAGHLTVRDIQGVNALNPEVCSESISGALRHLISAQ